jgi:hypothetical protein
VHLEPRITRWIQSQLPLQLAVQVHTHIDVCGRTLRIRQALCHGHVALVAVHPRTVRRVPESVVGPRGWCTAVITVRHILHTAALGHTRLDVLISLLGHRDARYV